MNKLKLVSEFQPSGDQVKAIKELTTNLKKNVKEQVLLGATGTGKTFTISNVIQNVQKPTLVLAHNKTLAAQLYGELKKYFPENRVEYFISYFDYYQPEAYVASTDTYIEKTSQINQEIELMRLSTLNSLQNRNDVIVVASVACIYSQNNPQHYRDMTFDLRVGEELKRSQLLAFLVSRGYSRNDVATSPATFRVKGDVIEISPGWTSEYFIRIELFGNEIDSISTINTITKNTIKKLDLTRIYPANGFISSEGTIKQAVKEIRSDLTKRLKYFQDEKKEIEFQRLKERVSKDAADLEEFGMCPGIENYSRYLDGRLPNQTPFSLFDYFPKDYLLIVDESHQMIPQIRGMFNGDRSRKENLVNYGFRLPSALENRPLKFEEFEKNTNNIIYVSATPAEYELDKTKGVITEQVIRPTGLLDPKISIVETKNQIQHIIKEIKKAAKKKQRVLITALTKKMAEDITEYLKENNIKSAYLHSEIKTLERSVVINDLRRGKYDVLVGINLLREGLDIPEVSTICILDADKQGFLRSERSLIQIVGRAARNADGHVFMYADKTTQAMQRAIEETNRRRKKQSAYNKKNNIVPKTIIKDIDHSLRERIITSFSKKIPNTKKITKSEKQLLIDDLNKQMKTAAKEHDFETAAYLRDFILDIKAEK